jgi:hypothetical protein
MALKKRNITVFLDFKDTNVDVSTLVSVLTPTRQLYKTSELGVTVSELTTGS